MTDYVKRKATAADHEANASVTEGTEYWFINLPSGKFIPMAANCTEDQVKAAVAKFHEKVVVNTKTGETNWFGEAWRGTIGQGTILSGDVNAKLEVIKGDYQKYTAEQSKEGQVEAAKLGKEGQVEAAQKGKEGQVEAAQKGKEGQVEAAQKGKEGQVEAAQKGKEGQIAGVSGQQYTANLGAVSQVYQTSGGVFQAQIKLVLDAGTEMNTKTEDLTIDRSSFMAKKDIFQYLELLNIAPKLIRNNNVSANGTMTLSDGTVVKADGQVKPADLNMLLQQVDYSQVHIDKTLVFERAATGEVQSESDPMTLYYIPQDVKEQRVGKKAEASDIVHNVPEAVKVMREKVNGQFKYFYTDATGALVEAEEKDVYAKYKLTDKPSIGDNTAPGSDAAHKDKGNNFDQPLESIFCQVNKANETLYHQQPATQQHLFDLLLHNEDLNARKAKAGLINGWMESMPAIAGLFKLLLAIFPDMFSGHKKHGKEQHNTHGVNFDNVNSPADLEDVLMKGIISGMPPKAKSELEHKYKDMRTNNHYTDQDRQELMEIIIKKGDLNPDQLDKAKKVVNALGKSAGAKLDYELDATAKADDLNPNGTTNVGEMAVEVTKKANKLYLDDKDISESDKKEILEIIKKYGYKDVDLNSIIFEAPKNNAPAKIDIHSNTAPNSQFKIKEIILH